MRAIDRLRYLDTPDSTRQLARELRGENLLVDRECLLGLLTAKSRETAIEEVNRLIADPEFPVADRFLDAFSWLTVEPNSQSWPQSTRDYQQAMATARQQLREHIVGKADTVTANGPIVLHERFFVANWDSAIKPTMANSLRFTSDFPEVIDN